MVEGAARMKAPLLAGDGLAPIGSRAASAPARSWLTGAPVTPLPEPKRQAASNAVLPTVVAEAHEEGAPNYSPDRTPGCYSDRSPRPRDYATEFPPLVSRPGRRVCTVVLYFTSIIVVCLTVLSDWLLEHFDITADDVLKYASIPLVSTLFTYYHIWAALYMTFYPVKFRGCWQIGGTNCGCGWQGIVPSKADKMARTSVHLMTSKLLKVSDVFARIDPQMVAEELDPVLHSMLMHIIQEVALQEEPQLWESLPVGVKNELIVKAREQAPPVIKDMMNDVKSNIETVFDLTDMVVQTLIRDPGLLNHMFISCGYNELEFIKDCGAYMGIVFGTIQVILWMWWSAGWMLPTFGLIVGLASNWVALKMIFEPVEPISLFGGKVVIQGLFLKRQREVSQEYGRIVASNVLSSKYLIPAIINGPCSDKLFEVIHLHIHSACDKYTGVTRPFLRFFAGQDKYNKCKRIIAERLIANLSDTMRHVEKHLDHAMDLERVLSEKMAALPATDFENLLHPVFQEDEWKLVLMGGLLGWVVGCVQWWTLGS